MRITIDSFISSVILEPGTHQNTDVIFIRFPYNLELINFAKSIKGKWSQSNKAWYVPNNAQFRDLFHLENNYIGKDVLSKIMPINQDALTQLTNELILRAYSPATLKTYLVEFAQLLYLIKNVPVQSLSYDKLRSYFLYCINELKISENQLHSRINAIKFYFEKVLKQEKFAAEIPRPKKPSLLPVVLSQKDIAKIFQATNNSKHLLMLQLSYGMGLRVSEIAHLKITNIDSNRMQVHIQGAKGKKDRYVNLPESILTLLRTYYTTYQPKEFLFEGQYGGSYSIRSVQQVFKTALNKAKINKKIGIHGLRHSYATHLLEYGTDVSFIQKLLGHNQVTTTLIYAKVSKHKIEQVKSPLDRML